MVDARRTLDAILSKWGHDILLQRRDPEGGWEDTLERHTVRHTYPATRGLPQIMQERREGNTHTIDMVYYFRRDANPKEGDRIYEKDERYPGGQTTWLIDYALPVHGKGGRIDFWTAGVTREGPN